MTLHILTDYRFPRNPNAETYTLFLSCISEYESGQGTDRYSAGLFLARAMELYGRNNTEYNYTAPDSKYYLDDTTAAISLVESEIWSDY